MKLFLTKTIAFILLAIGITFLLDTLTASLERKLTSFNLDKNPKYIIVGHSHVECAYNDSIIYNLKNLGKSAEPYFYSYFKIQQVINQNPSIETVFVEFTNNQINKSNDTWIWGEKHLSQEFPTYSSFMSMSDKSLIVKNNFIGFQNALSLSLKNKIINAASGKFTSHRKIGGYRYLQRDKTDSIVRNLAFDTTQNQSVSISEISLLYLDRIIKLCNEKNKRIVLIRSPLHEIYRRHSNESTYRKILNDRFSHIEYLDFSKFPLTNSEYGDLEHLNYKGAKVFSKWFQSLLYETEILSKPDKQRIIDDLIERERETRFYQKPN